MRQIAGAMIVRNYAAGSVRGSTLLSEVVTLSGFLLAAGKNINVVRFLRSRRLLVALFCVPLSLPNTSAHVPIMSQWMLRYQGLETLKSKLKDQIFPKAIADVKEFRAKHGNASLGTVTVEQVCSADVPISIELSAGLAQRLTP